MRPSPKNLVALGSALVVAASAHASRAAEPRDATDDVSESSARPANANDATDAADATGATESQAPSIDDAEEDAAPRAAAPADVALEGIDLESDLSPKDRAEETLVETPPPPPYKKTLVLDSTIGALFFGGKFGSVAGPAPWIHTQLGYELLDWLMLFGEGELAFADTSRAQAPPHTRAFPMFGFGGGARFTVRFTPRVGAYLQASVGAMKADVAKNALALLGFKNAESLGVYGAARAGVEWYQRDRHFALGLSVGLRDASGFAKTIGSDTPLAYDAGASLRYAF